MSTQAERQASDVTPPTSGDITAADWILALSTSGTAAYVDFSAYDSAFDRYVDVRADGGVIYVAASKVTTAIDRTATGATILDADGVAKCWPIADGETVSMRLTKLTPYLHYQAASGTPTLRVRSSSGRSVTALSRGL